MLQVKYNGTILRKEEKLSEYSAVLANVMSQVVLGYV